MCGMQGMSVLIESQISYGKQHAADSRDRQQDNT
jgi:hypothetical protein